MEGVDEMQRDKRQLEEAESLLGKKIKTEPAEKVIGQCILMEGNSEIELLGSYARNENVSLRQKIRQWLDQYKNIGPENMKQCLKDLVNLRSVSARVWRKEVLCLREIQKKLIWIVKYAKTMTNQEERNDLIATVRQILHPVDKIRIDMFPNIREMAQRISDEPCSKEPYPMRNIKQLPDVLKERTDQIPEQVEIMELSIRDIQLRLESTMNVQSQSQDYVYEYLVCVSVLQLFGFTINGFLFQYPLSKNDLVHAGQMLDSHLTAFGGLHYKVQEQAYLLNLALCCCTQERQAALQYIFSKIPEGMCPELEDATGKCGQETIDTKQLQHVLDRLLCSSPVQNKLIWKSLLHSLKSQLHFLRQLEEHMDPPSETAGGSLRRSVEVLLEILDFKKYFPQKLTYKDMIKLSSDAFSDGGATPTVLTQLPWYFIRHIIALDSDTREDCHVPKGRNGDDTENSSDSDADTVYDVHPLDLIYIIFLCADDFLRQELADKMVKCQYAVPFVLPPPQEDNSSNNHQILHWGLKSIIRNFYCNNRVLNQTLVEASAPVIIFMGVGKDTSWKERIANKMLSPQQDTFWHEGLKGGDCMLLCSHRIVEVAWYLPGRHADNKFQYPVTFLNLRNTVQGDVIYDQLYTFSTLACIFVTEINDEIWIFLRSKPVLDNIILVVLHKKEDEKEVKNKKRELQETLGLEKHQIIRKSADESHFNAVYEQMKEVIEQKISMGMHGCALSAFVANVREEETVRVDDHHCYHAQMAANSILKDIDEYNEETSRKAKDAILPCQSEIKQRQEIAALEKELCRQRKLRENITVQNYAFGVKQKKWQLQLNQLQKPISGTFSYFLQCLQRFNPKERLYFLQCLKFGLNERSEQLLQPLYEEYERCRVEVQSETKDKKLRAINDRLTHASLGIEHFFREMSVMYENLMALEERTRCTSELDDILHAMSRTMANVFKEGTAIEIMDGDAVHVPVVWIDAVLNSFEKSSESTLLKVSVLGAQSCGKSTLLNTMFGLNFPVSSGRCTRGAYMQLVKVDDSLKKTLHCDYVAVIDSEGLMSRTKTDDSDYDNELSTFIIGLSDLTLVIIKGEGSEMNDVLPLAIHVFLRMNIVGEHQACHFVHQNMGAVDAMTKVSTEIDAFVRELNEKTLAAAKDADQSDKYTKFTDVLHYDPATDNTYVPGLWNGTPPMAKTNSHYSKTLQALKMAVFTSVMKMQDCKGKKLCTFNELAKRLDELWNAIKYENFVLSFKNVLAVEAHKKLTKVFDEEQWTLKREIQEMIQQEKCSIENEIMGGQSTKTTTQLILSSTDKIRNCMLAKAGQIEKKIQHYFQCPGCDECDTAVTNRHLLVNNEKEFCDEVRFLKRGLQKELESSMDKFEVKMTTDKRIYELSTKMDDLLKNKVEEAIHLGKSQDLTSNRVEDMFEKLWDEATEEIQKTVKGARRDENIEACIQQTIRSLLGSEDHLYMQVATDPDSVMSRMKNKYGKIVFIVNRQMHMNLNLQVWTDYRLQITDQDVNRLQMTSDQIISQAKKYYDCSAPDGEEFDQNYAAEMFKDVIDQIDNITDQRFKITHAYKAHMILFIEKVSVKGFTVMHENYCKHNSLEALLDEKRNSYRDLFVLSLGHENAALNFCENFLKQIIFKNIDEQLSCTELLHDLRLHCGNMFRDIKSIQASVMTDMLREEKFVNFIEYITDYKSCVKRKMTLESVRYFDGGKRYKELARASLDRICGKILQAIDATVKSSCSNTNFIRTFFSRIEHLRISHNEASAYLHLKVSNQKQFQMSVHQLLKGRIRNDIIKKINYWGVSRKLQQKKLSEFLFKELVGCTATCPFCKVPCDAHSGGKRQGKHTATWHRPGGLGSYRWTNTNKLMVGDCRAYVASGYEFVHDDDETQSTPYRDFNQMYPDWIIHGDADPDREKYWKWVFAEYNEQFADYWSALEAELPLEWGQYDKRVIVKDIEDHYNIRVDMLKVRR